MSKWDKFSKPPSTALKSIAGGRLKGMTDVNPQWRYKAMTDVYGACGEGWKYSIDRLWLEDGVAGEKTAFAQVSLCVKENGQWSDPIPGIGGSMLIAKESSGLRTSDEAYKMAVTDALSVAMKMLGVAADIYMGLWDGSKYKDVPPEKKDGDKPEDKPYQDAKKALEACGSMNALANVWLALPPEQRKTLLAVKEECKKRIAEADKVSA